MMLFLQFFEISVFFLCAFENFDFACPSSDHNIFKPTRYIIMLYLIRICSRQFLPFHRPHINNSIRPRPSRNNIFLTAINMYSTSIRFQQIPTKLSNLLKINSTFPNKLIINNSFIKIQCSIIIFLSNTYSSCLIIIKIDKIFLGGCLFEIFFPFFQVEES